MVAHPDATGEGVLTATSSQINPDQGTFSNIGGVGNVWVACGARIENAIGGSASDVPAGNELVSALGGDGGHDRLYGGAGADTLYGERAPTQPLGGVTGNDVRMSGGAGDGSALRRGGQRRGLRRRGATSFMGLPSAPEGSPANRNFASDPAILEEQGGPLREDAPGPTVSVAGSTPERRDSTVASQRSDESGSAPTLFDRLDRAPRFHFEALAEYFEAEANRKQALLTGGQIAARWARVRDVAAAPGLAGRAEDLGAFGATLFAFGGGAGGVARVAPAGATCCRDRRRHRGRPAAVRGHPGCDPDPVARDSPFTIPRRSRACW